MTRSRSEAEIVSGGPRKSRQIRFKIGGGVRGTNVRIGSTTECRCAFGGGTEIRISRPSRSACADSIPQHGSRSRRERGAPTPDGPGHRPLARNCALSDFNGSGHGPCPRPNSTSVGTSIHPVSPQCSRTLASTTSRHGTPSVDVTCLEVNDLVVTECCHYLLSDDESCGSARR